MTSRCPAVPAHPLPGVLWEHVVSRGEREEKTEFRTGNWSSSPSPGVSAEDAPFPGGKLCSSSRCGHGEARCA